MPSMPRPFRSDGVTDAAIAWLAEKHQLSARAVSSTYGIAPGTARKIVSRANPRRFTGRSYVPILTLSDLPSARRSWVKHHGLRGYSNRFSTPVRFLLVIAIGRLPRSKPEKGATAGITYSIRERRRSSA
ncbi:hypothetical protein KXW38_001811 [Aspergillus fumigatus]|nr:hypothetical protein KXW38_001811 [Aspergillus fumigatus]